MILILTAFRNSVHHIKWDGQLPVLFSFYSIHIGLKLARRAIFQADILFINAQLHARCFF